MSQLQSRRKYSTRTDSGEYVRTDTLPFAILQHVIAGKGSLHQDDFAAYCLTLCGTQDHSNVTVGRMLTKGLIQRRVVMMNKNAVDVALPGLAKRFHAGWMERSEFVATMDELMAKSSKWDRTVTMLALFRSGGLERRVTVTAAGVQHYKRATGQ